MMKLIVFILLLVIQEAQYNFGVEAQYIICGSNKDCKIDPDLKCFKPNPYTAGICLQECKVCNSDHDCGDYHTPTFKCANVQQGKQRYCGTSYESTDKDSCKCIDDCYAAMIDEALRVCGWENRTCFCSATLKGIHCMEPCPDCPRKYDLVQGLKRYYEKTLQCGPIMS
ncbi:hypothetical protein Ddc_14784 [Ditylenchus destructor]|nr:hypothetical protein Ddc_14784 [Ditylenchus destructor]